VSDPTFVGRDLQVWHPIITLARFFEENGVHDLEVRVMTTARRMIDDSREDVIPECDEFLLRELASAVESGQRDITAGLLLELARTHDPSVFNGVSARRVGSILKGYDIRTHKSSGRRTYDRVNVDDIREIEQRHDIDFGLRRQTKPGGDCVASNPTRIEGGDHA
jgi:hypothetical protein